MSYNELNKGRFSAAGQEYFVTFNTESRRPVLCQYEIASTLARIIHEQEDIYIWAWVIMPDHVHILLELKFGTLGEAIGSIKGRASRKINLISSKDFKWAKGYYDHALRREEDRKDIARYIIANPLRAKLVKSLRHYPCWNAAFL